MIAHKCDGCRYKGEHVEMGFKPFGVCYKETNLIKAEENYNAETCPYKQNEGRETKPFLKFARQNGRSTLEAEQFLKYLYETEDEPEAEPVQWPKENPYITPDQEAALQEACEKLTQGLQKMTAMLAPAFAAIAAAAVEMARWLAPALKLIAETSETIIEQYPNKRVLHLAKHGKKARTRKKNINRIKKYFEQESKKRAVFAQN